MRFAYLHNLPLEYYPPTSNFLDLLGRQGSVQVRAYTTQNRKGREAYSNPSIEIRRSSAPDPDANSIFRLLVALWWHLNTAVALFKFKPDAVFYVEPHSAIAAWLYYKLLRGKARLLIHHHEYYEPQDFCRPGMRLPRLGSRLERRDLFGRAEWISQTNEDRLRLARGGISAVPDSCWRVLPNYPPKAWGSSIASERSAVRAPLRLIYVGSVSFEDTYIREIVEWATCNQDEVLLHVCGYNVAPDVWHWLDQQQFANVSHDAGGYHYDDLPGILWEFDIGLVLYKCNTTNFIYNVPNKVFEYLVCGLEVWYPQEMAGMRKFREQKPARLLELDFKNLDSLSVSNLKTQDSGSFNAVEFTAERALAPLFQQLGIGGSPKIV